MIDSKYVLNEDNLMHPTNVARNFFDTNQQENFKLTANKLLDS